MREGRRGVSEWCDGREERRWTMSRACKSSVPTCRPVRKARRAGCRGCRARVWALAEKEEEAGSDGSAARSSAERDSAQGRVVSLSLSPTNLLLHLLVLLLLPFSFLCISSPTP